MSTPDSRSLVARKLAAVRASLEYRDLRDADRVRSSFTPDVAARIAQSDRESLYRLHPPERWQPWSFGELGRAEREREQAAEAYASLFAELAPKSKVRGRRFVLCWCGEATCPLSHWIDD
jgi:hypothetical protein